MTQTDNAATFGRQAAVYARGRPGYPDALFDWIADNSPACSRVWDVATGSGQAATSLAERFSQVEATDISAEQIAVAKPHSNIRYRVTPAETSGLPDNSVDAITIATGVHWFAGEAFWNEVRRVARPGALLCAWTYQLPIGEPDVQTLFLDPVYAAIDPYWAEGNRICMRGYSAEALDCPFPTLDTPTFDADGLWAAKALADFAQSWSAHLRAREDRLADGLARLRARFFAQLGETPLPIRLPLSVMAARID